jgi:hypothetical protein
MSLLPPMLIVEHVQHHAHRSLIAEPNYFGRPKHRNRRLLQVAKTCYTGSEQDIAKDGKQDISPLPRRAIQAQP